MRKKKSDIIVWDMRDGLTIDLPRTATITHMSTGIRVSIPTPKDTEPLASLVNCIGNPLVKS